MKKKLLYIAIGIAMFPGFCTGVHFEGFNDAIRKMKEMLR